ncbi:MAG: hypothetical protein AAF226_08050, partial [Verrucomicrobiota bacterium]
SVNVIAEITPSPEKGGLSLQPGLFLQANIQGEQLRRVAKVPLTAFIDDNQVVLIDAENRLDFRSVEVARRTADHAYVAQGLNPGEKLCITELPTMVEGLEVQIAPSEPAN